MRTGVDRMSNNSPGQFQVKYDLEMVEMDTGNGANGGLCLCNDLITSLQHRYNHC